MHYFTGQIIALSMLAGCTPPAASDGANKTQGVAGLDRSYDVDVSGRFGSNDRSSNLPKVFDDPLGDEFLAAAKAQDLSRMRAIAAQGFSLTAQGHDDLNAALAYVAYVHPVRSDVLSEMLKLGADPFQSAKHGQTLAEALASVPDARVLELFDLSGKDINTRAQPSDQTLLEAAVFYNNTVLVDALIAQGVDVNSKPLASGSTAIRGAIATGRYEMVALLLAAGADPRIDDPALASTRSAWLHDRDRGDLFIRNPRLRPGHRALEQYLEAQGMLKSGLPVSD